jgi:hypothetical protein
LELLGAKVRGDPEHGNPRTPLPAHGCRAEFAGLPSPGIPHRDGTDATGRLPAKVELHASAAQIAVYLIAYVTLVVTGGRLGDIYGAQRVHIRRCGLHRHLAGAIRP